MKKFSFILVLTIAAFLLNVSLVYSQTEKYPLPEDAYEGIFEFTYANVLAGTIGTIHYKDSTYIPMTEVLSRLLIYHEYDKDNLIVKGFYIHPDTSFFFDFINKTAELGDKENDISENEFVLNDFDVYVVPSLIKRIFNINITTDFSKLAIRIHKGLSDVIDLPLYTKLYKQNLYDKIADNKQNFEYSPLLFDRDWSFLDGGLLDYSLNLSQYTDNRVYGFGTNFGLEILGGDLSGRVSGSLNENINLFSFINEFKWRYFFGDNPFFTQASVGYLTTPGYKSNPVPTAPLRGVQISNETQNVPMYFDDFLIQDKTTPGWQVELWIDGQIEDQMIAEPDGFYRFTIPLKFGYTTIEVKIYGTKGEIVETREVLQVPSEFYQPGEIKYVINAGETLGDGVKTAESVVSIGLTNWLSNSTHLHFDEFSQGMEYYNHSAARLFGNVIANFDTQIGEFYKVGAFASFGTSGSFNAFYTRTDQSVLNEGGSFIQSYEAAVGLPRFWDLPFNFRLRGNRREYTGYNNNSFAADMNGYLYPFGISARYLINSTDYIGSSPSSDNRMTQSINGNISYSWINKPGILEFTGNTRFRLNADYDITSKQLNFVGLNMDQSIMRLGYLRAGVVRDMISKSTRFDAGIILDFASFRSDSRARYYSEKPSFTQAISGTLGYNSNDNILFANNPRTQIAVGSGAASLRFFLDENENGTYDSDEHVIHGVKFDMQNARIVNDKESDIRVAYGLPAYGRYNVRIDPKSFRNPLWVPEITEFSFIADPNKFKNMDIPCYSAGVIEGIVTKNDGREAVPQAGVKVHVMRKDSSFYEKLPVFSDGSFYLVGVPPGDYIAWVDSAQKSILNVKSNPEQLAFTVKKSTDGDYLDGLDFELLTQEAYLAKADDLRPSIPSTDVTDEEESVEEDVVEEVADESTDVAEVVIPTEETNDAVTPNEQPKPKVAITPNTSKIFTFSDSKSVKLSSSMVEYLDGIVDYLKSNSSAEISIVGHTDNFGTFDETQEISEGRANAAVKYLTSKGIAKNRILSRGEGARSPVSSNLTEDGRKQNRRLEIFVIE